MERRRLEYFVAVVEHGGFTAAAPALHVAPRLPAYDLVKNFNWTNDDRNTVAEYIALDKMTPDAAAKKWIDADPDKVKAWLR